MSGNHYDIFIIGGGINGAGVARDASGRGYKVALVEQKDFASATSSASTKLIHGGLRYLEQYAFKMVREALIERDVLWRIAPHLVQPIRFILPSNNKQHPNWMVRAGLFLYDHLGGTHNFPKAVSVSFAATAYNPLQNKYRKGFEYSDAAVDDSRLVIANLRDAHENGATILPRMELIEARAINKKWVLTVRNTQTGAIITYSASYLVNMAGPWLGKIWDEVLKFSDPAPLRLIKGSHIVTRALYPHKSAYLLQNEDGRVILMRPYQKDFTLIGTTDIEYDGDLGKISITQEEIDYLINAVGKYFSKPITRQDIISTYAGVRPLFNNNKQNAQSVTRDYLLKERIEAGGAPLLTAFGGKITVYRKLAEDAMAYIEKSLGPREKGAWTASKNLPGGAFDYRNFDALVKKVADFLPFLTTRTHERLALAYGSDVFKIFSGKKETLGKHFGHELYAEEVDWLKNFEWAKTAEDVLWRRTKLGLLFTPAESQELESFLVDCG